MSPRLQIVLTPEQYAFLTEESSRSSVSMGELVRRAIDTTYGPRGDRVFSVITHTRGRRAGKPFAGYGVDAGGSASPSQ
jgi:hypothetical protein